MEINKQEKLLTANKWIPLLVLDLGISSGTKPVCKLCRSRQNQPAGRGAMGRFKNSDHESDLYWLAAILGFATQNQPIVSQNYAALPALQRTP